MCSLSAPVPRDPDSRVVEYSSVIIKLHITHSIIKKKKERKKERTKCSAKLNIRLRTSSSSFVCYRKDDNLLYIAVLIVMDHLVKARQDKPVLIFSCLSYCKQLVVP